MLLALATDEPRWTVIGATRFRLFRRRGHRVVHRGLLRGHPVRSKAAQGAALSTPGVALEFAIWPDGHSAAVDRAGAVDGSRSKKGYERSAPSGRGGDGAVTDGPAPVV